jgi:thioesterase domain-containing protein
VKISGVRIEPAEIEGALVDEGLAREAAVVAWQGKLAAYLVPRAPGLDPAEVRRRLRARLPAIMVPPLVIMLEELPRTASGKLDHKALPAPEEPARNVARVAGRDQAEELLLGALRRAAGRDVGLTEDIFEAGLDSLAALAFCARVEVVLGRRLPLEVLVEARTVERLARALRADAPERPSPTLVPFRTEGAVPPFFCVHPRPGHVFAYLGLAHHLGEEIPFYGLQARGLDGREPPQRDLGEMVASYLGEVRRTQPRGPYHLGGFCAGGVIAMEMARALVAQGESVALLVLCDTKFPRHGLSRLVGELGRARRVLRAPLSTAFRLARRLLRGRAAVPGTGTRGEARLRQIMESILRSYRPQPYAGSLLVVESTRVASDQRFASPRTWVGVASREREVVELAFGHDELLQSRRCRRWRLTFAAACSHRQDDTPECHRVEAHGRDVGVAEDVGLEEPVHAVEDGPASGPRLGEMDGVGQVGSEGPVPLRSVARWVGAHLSRRDREVPRAIAPPGQIELPAQLVDGDVVDGKLERVQRRPVPLAVEEDVAQGCRHEVRKSEHVPR